MFQREVEHAMSTINGPFVFLDDAFLGSDTEEQHRALLEVNE